MQMRQMGPPQPWQQTKLPGQEHVYKFGIDVREVTPAIPDAVMDNIMAQGGMFTSDVAVVRTLTIACQKFISEVLFDIAVEKKSHPATATVDDVKRALENHGFQSSRPDYLVGEMEKESEDLGNFADMDFQFQEPFGW